MESRDLSSPPLKKNEKIKDYVMWFYSKCNSVSGKENSGKEGDLIQLFFTYKSNVRTWGLFIFPNFKFEGKKPR